MYIAPIEFEEVRHWFLNVDKRFKYLCMFLNGNGEYNEVINEEILNNRYLIDRTTGDSICYFFCSSFNIEGDFRDFNYWNVRNRELSKTIIDKLLDQRKSSSLQSELLREDVCDYYQISRTSLPALVFISKNEDVYTYQIKSFKDIRILLTPLGIIGDYLRDKARIESRKSDLYKNIQRVDKEISRYNELKKATENAEENYEYAKQIIEKIIDICQKYDFDVPSLEKMGKHPEKIQQIISMHKIQDEKLFELLSMLNDYLPQYRMVKSGRLLGLQEELSKLSGTEGPDYNEYKNEIKKENNLLEECRIASINQLKELSTDIDAEHIIDLCSVDFDKNNNEPWLIPVLKALQNRKEHGETLSDNRITIKCFIAGAKALERERDAIISGINDQNIANKHTRRFIECYTFKNFDSHFTKEGHQAAYNSFIKDQADIVIFALDDVVGGITKQEFSVAVEALKQKNYKSPIIFVFSNVENEGKEQNPDIREVREQINEVHQYWIDYTSLEVLKLKLQLKINTLYG